jgi:hypothetical protein
MRTVRHPAAHAITLTLGGIGTARIRRIALAVAQRFGATPVCNPRLTLQVVYTPCDSETITASLASLDFHIPPIRLFVVDVEAQRLPDDPSHLRIHCTTGPSASLLALRRQMTSVLREHGLEVLPDEDEAWVPRIPVLSGRFPRVDVAGLVAEVREATMSCAFSVRSLDVSRQTKDGRRVLERCWRLLR